MSKVPVAIVTDSTNGLPEDIIKKHNIHVIPLILNWEGVSILDGIDITPLQFYKRLATSTESPTTSQPSVGEFYEFFSKVAESAESILGIFISDELSGTLSSARAAVDMLDVPITIVDSRLASMALGLVVLEAARAVTNGATAEEGAAVARAAIARTRIVFYVDTLDYLHRGGRIGGARRFVGSLLSMKPILQLEDGRIEPLQSVRTRKKALKYTIDHVLNEVRGHSNVKISVLHANALETANEVGAELRQANPTEFILSEVSPVIGTHVGPGTIGIAYMI
jgi:DegV family protein with EDD domain